ncbi:unnamed protein product [Symbiodinium sp. CCMP2592]|nr:unnamed protein product [Symbiodinium sp. CCMP2592]
MEEDPENAEDLFGSAYFDEVAEASSPVEDQELAPELRPSKRLRCEAPELEGDGLEEEEVEMAWSRSTTSDAAGRLACTPPQSLSAMSHVEEVLQMEEDEDAGEQEAEDKEEEEDPKEKPQGGDQQEKGIFNSSSSSSIPGADGNALGSQAPLQEGSGSASSGLGRADEVPAPVNPSSRKVDIVQDVPEIESSWPTKAKVAQETAETEGFSSTLQRPARGQASSSQATLQVEEVRTGSDAASGSSASGPRVPSEPKDAAAALPTATSSAKASPRLIDPETEAAAKTAAAAAASKMAPKPGSISANADSAIDGVWCTTHFQYRWRCRQDGVSDACEAGWTVKSFS